MTTLGNLDSPRLPKPLPTAERSGPDMAAGAAVWQAAPVMRLPNLRVDVSIDVARAVVRLDGELDIASSGPLAQRFSDLLFQGHTRIVVDLTRLTFCDAAGLRAFVTASRLAKTHRGWLRIAAAQPRMTRIISIADLSRILPGYKTTQDALES